MMLLTFVNAGHDYQKMMVILTMLHLVIATATMTHVTMMKAITIFICIIITTIIIIMTVDINIIIGRQ